MCTCYDFFLLRFGFTDGTLDVPIEDNGSGRESEWLGRDPWSVNVNGELRCVYSFCCGESTSPVLSLILLFNDRFNLKSGGFVANCEVEFVLTTGKESLDLVGFCWAWVGNEGFKDIESDGIWWVLILLLASYKFGSK